MESPKSVKAKKTSPNSKTKRIIGAKMIEQIIKDNKINMSTKEGQHQLLQIITSMGKR